jgi:hypothetical protein
MLHTAIIIAVIAIKLQSSIGSDWSLVLVIYRTSHPMIPFSWVPPLI